jgi:hypothetical protein
MAGHGMAPKGTRSRARDAKARDAEMTPLDVDDEVRGPDLPEGVLPDDETWHPQTRRWWETWRHSPMAATFLDTDWDFLLDTALLHHVFWTKGRWEFGSEVRLRAAKFGATPEDRMRLKLKVNLPGTGAEPAAETPRSVTARRKNLRIVAAEQESTG